MAKTTARVRHLRDRGGRYFARVAVPAPLQKIVGKIELLEPLGPDRRDAIFRLPASVARFNQILADARRGMPPAPLPVSIPHAVHDRYRAELREDDRNRYEDNLPMRPTEFNALFSSTHLHRLRKVAKGFINEADMIDGGMVEATIGWAIDEATIVKGKPRPTRGTQAWIDLARALCSAQVEAIERSIERDDGNDKGQPTYSLLTVPPPTPDLETAPLSIEGLFQGYLTSLARSGRGVEAGKRWRSVFNSLIEHLGHDDARTLTKADIRTWIETLHGRLAEKTIKDTYLGAVKAVFTDAFDHERLPSNPTSGVKIKLAKPDQGRERGFTTVEALAILRLSRAYEPKLSDNPQTRESESLVSAKRWAPLLCALTGARIAEITQLRKEDIREQDGIPYLRITPEAGSVKTGQYRDVPLHRQLIEVGFLDLVKRASSGPLFFKDNPASKAKTHPSKTVSGRLSQWLQTLGVVPENVSPNHGWRHGFKTIGMDHSVEVRILDAIQGHAPRTAGEAYGDVSLKAKAKAIDLFPNFAL